MRIEFRRKDCDLRSRELPPLLQERPWATNPAKIAGLASLLTSLEADPVLSCSELVAEKTKASKINPFYALSVRARKPSSTPAVLPGWGPRTVCVTSNQT